MMKMTPNALKKQLATLNDPLAQIETLSQLAMLAIDRNLGEAYAYIQALRIITENPDLSKEVQRIGSGWFHCHLGWYRLRRTEHQLALQSFQQAAHFFEQQQPGKRTAENGLGVVYLQLAQFDKALEYFLQALGTEEEIDAFTHAGILNNLGVLYLELSNFEQADDYLKRSFELSEKSNDQRQQAAALDNQSNLYFLRKEHQKALTAAQKSIKLSRAVESSVFEAESLNSAGDAYMALGKPTLALEHYHAALNLATDIGHVYEKVEAMTRIGTVYLENREEKKAAEYLYPALSLAQQTGANRLEYQIYKALAELSETQQNYRLALQYYKLYHAIQQEVFGLRADWRLKSLQITHQVETDQHLRLSNAQLQGRLKKIENLQQQLEKQATRDPLTGLYNRRYLDDVLPKEILRQEREGGSLSLVIMDIDFFKKINDQFGHAAGDEVLIALAQLLRQHTRASDTVYRYGGDEFVVALPGAEPQEALLRCIEWRKAFANLKFDFAKKTLTPSISLGIASFPKNALTIETLFFAADEALYKSKIYRNHVTLSSKKATKNTNIT